VIYKKDWKILNNWGLEDKKETLDLEIPAWIKNWSFLKYSWRGNDWVWNVPTWDLYVKINVEESSKYSRQQDDLYTSADVSIFDVVLWWEVEVSHPEWKIKVKIPKWTQIGQKIRVSGKGFWEKGLFSKRWDMIVDLKINIPKRLTKEQEKLWKELQKAN
jgi:curved DNA-binding protein